MLNFSSRNLEWDSKAFDENILVRQRVLKFFQVWLHSDQMREWGIRDVCRNAVGTTREERKRSWVLRISMAASGEEATTRSCLPKRRDIRGPYSWENLAVET